MSIRISIALSHLAPLGRAYLLHFSDFHTGARQQFANQRIADAGAAADIHARVGVGHNTGAGLNRGITAGRAVVVIAAGVAGTVDGSLINVQVAAGNPAAGLGIAVHVHIQVVPSVPLTQHPSCGAPSQFADNLTISSAGNPDVNAVGVDDSCQLTGVGVVLVVLIFVQVGGAIAADVLAGPG